APAAAPVGAPTGSGAATAVPNAAAAVGGVLAALGAAINSPLGRMIVGRATTQVARGVMGALLGPPPRRRRYRFRRPGEAAGLRPRPDRRRRRGMPHARRVAVGAVLRRRLAVPRPGPLPFARARSRVSRSARELLPSARAPGVVLAARTLRRRVAGRLPR